MGGGVDGDHDLSAGPSVDQVPDGGGRLVEREGPVDDRGDVTCCNVLDEHGEVGMVLGADPRPAEVLADERGQQRGAQHAVGAAEPPTAALATDDRQPPRWREGTPQAGQPGVAADVEDLVVAAAAVGGSMRV